MTLQEWLWWALGSVGLLYWVASAVGAELAARRVPVLGALSPREPGRWPKLSIIIPACNEASTLEPALRSKLAEGYPDVELVLVNDRSTDGTGAIVDRMAAEDARVTPLHIRALPDGWLGKLNAMNEGVKRAGGEWLLFSDADIHYTPGVLRRAIAYCEEQGLDHLAVFPEIWRTRLDLDIFTACFSRIVFLVGRVWSVADPKSKAFAGVGAFNLVRRSALERTRGFEWLKLEAGDDMALGQMLKQSGARNAIVNGRGQVGLYFYQTLGEAIRSAEKGAAFMRFSVALSVAFGVVMLGLELSAFLALLPGAPLGVRAMGLIGVAAALFAQLRINRFMGHPVVPALLVPLGSIAMALTMARAGIVGALRGGVKWRGTLYPAQALMEGRRIGLG
jgi:hypothetical protein